MSEYVVKFVGQGQIHDRAEFQRDFVSHRNKIVSILNADVYGKLNDKFDEDFPNEEGGIDNSVYIAWMQVQMLAIMIRNKLTRSEILGFTVDSDCDIVGYALKKTGLVGDIQAIISLE